MRAVVSLLRDAPIPATFTLISAPGEPKARVLDQWLRALAKRAGAKIEYRWIAVDEESRRYAREVGLDEARPFGVVVSLGVNDALISLANPSTAAARAWIEKRARSVVAHAQGRMRRVGYVGTNDNLTTQLHQAMSHLELFPLDLTTGVPPNVVLLLQPASAADQRSIDEFAKRGDQTVVTVPAALTTSSFIALMKAIDGRDADDDERACTDILASTESLPSPPADKAPETFHRPKETKLLGKEDVPRITRLEIESNGARIVAERSDAAWHLVAPVSADANAENVIHALENLSDVSLHEALPSGADAFLGLAGPGALHVVASAGSSKVVDIVVGRAGELGIAMRSTERRVARGFSQYLFDPHPKRWRRTTLWQVDRTIVKEIKVESDRAKWVFVRTGASWKSTRDGRPVSSPSAERIDYLVNAFSELRAEDFAEDGADTGLDKLLDKPWTLRFELDGGKRVSVQIGKPRTSGGGRYARVEGDPTIYVLPEYTGGFVDRLDAPK